MDKKISDKMICIVGDLVVFSKKFSVRNITEKSVVFFEFYKIR